MIFIDSLTSEVGSHCTTYQKTYTITTATATCIEDNGRGRRKAEEGSGKADDRDASICVVRDFLIVTLSRQVSFQSVIFSVPIFLLTAPKEIFRISHKSAFTKIATHYFYFYCTNLNEFRMDISMTK